MSPIRKPVYRESQATIRERGRSRAILVGIMPGDVLELRLKGTRRRYILGIATAFYQAVRLQAEHEKRERAALRRARRAGVAL